MSHYELFVLPIETSLIILSLCVLVSSWIVYNLDKRVSMLEDNCKDVGETKQTKLLLD